MRARAHSGAARHMAEVDFRGASGANGGVPTHDHFAGDLLPLSHQALQNVASIYNQAGDSYAAYADGDPERLFAFEGAHAYADRCVWRLLQSKLRERRAGGATAIRLLDAGCGPGTWLRRLVAYARALGYTDIDARGFDIAEAQIDRARSLAADLARLPGVKIRFDVASLTSRLSEPDASVDLSLCLYSVLSHLPVADLPAVADEFARCTAGHFVTAVRSVGSPPTAFVESLDKVRRLKLDNRLDRCEIELDDGRRLEVGFHLFKAQELQAYFAKRFDIVELRGLDIFHSRFAPDARWNPNEGADADALAGELARLEQIYADQPEFMDRATHLLLVARCRGAARS